MLPKTLRYCRRDEAEKDLSCVGGADPLPASRPRYPAPLAQGLASYRSRYGVGEVGLFTHALPSQYCPDEHDVEVVGDGGGLEVVEEEED